MRCRWLATLTQMILTTMIFPICLFASTAAAAPCDMRELNPKDVTKSSGKVKVGNEMELVIRMTEKRAKGPFGGPIAVVVSGNEKCAISGGIYSKMYVSESDRYLMTQEYPGAAGIARIFDLQSCQQIDEETYAGRATYTSHQLVSPPYCEPIGANGKTGSCSSAHVFEITGSECELKLNEYASQSLTKKTIGLELPLTGVFTVREMKTTNARIVETKAK